MVAVVAAVVVVVVAVAVVLVGRVGDDEPAGVEAAEELVAAFERQLDATYRLDGEFVRTRADGERLESGLLVVQRPPDRLQRSLGSTVGVVGGRTVNCGVPVAGGAYSCATGAAAAPWPERREEQLAAVRQFVLGDDPVYAVVASGEGCFELLRRREGVEATYGARAELCFDGPTGALRRLEVARDGGTVDVLDAVLVTAQVNDGDFDLTADETYDPTAPAGTDPGPVAAEE